MPDQPELRQKLADAEATIAQLQAALREIASANGIAQHGPGIWVHWWDVAYRALKQQAGGSPITL